MFLHSTSHHQISVFCHVSFFLVGFFQLLFLSMHRRFILCMYYLPRRCLWLWIFVVYAFAEVSAELFIFICFCAALLCTFILAFQSILLELQHEEIQSVNQSLHDFLSYLIPYSVLYTLLLSMFSIIGSEYISMYCTIDSHDVSCT